MQLPWQITLRPSGRLAALLWLAHGGIACTLILLLLRRPELSWLLLVLLSVTAVSLFVQMQHLYGARRVLGLTLNKDGTISVQCSDQTCLQGRIKPQTAVWPWMAVLLLRLDDGRHWSLTVLSDALSDDDFRRLRLWLRWFALNESAAGKRQAASRRG
ncbi:MAG: hypothetical protein KUL75_09395 [Sterolibacterium sp.]|nr:hypothetical protein [Sterolibacterium sp.]